VFRRRQPRPHLQLCCSGLILTPLFLIAQGGDDTQIQLLKNGTVRIVISALLDMTGHQVEGGVVVVAGGGLALHDGVFGVEVGGFAEGFNADA